MKIRITGTEKEFSKLMPFLEKNKEIFDSWQRPRKGGNPKYKDNNQLLSYIEINILELIREQSTALTK